MADKIKPLKIETTIDGTQSDPYPVEANPTQDYVAIKGVSFENTDDKIFDLSAGAEIQWKDANQTTYKTLNSIVGNGTALNPFTDLNVKKVPVGIYHLIKEDRQNIVTKKQKVFGVLIVDGVNTIL